MLIERTAKLCSRRSPHPTMVWVQVQACYSSNTTGWWNVQKEILCKSKHHFSLVACANTFLNTGYHHQGLFPWTCIQGSAIHCDWPSGIKSTMEWDHLLLGPAGWDCSPPHPSASEVGSSLWVPPYTQIYTQIWHHCSMLLLFFFDDSMSLSLNWQVDWFKGIEIFDFIVHAIRWSTSPGCILAQEYREDGDLAVWHPIIPNNTFLVTLISLVRLHPSNYYTIHIPP